MYAPPLSRWPGTSEQAVIVSGRRIMTAACLGLVRRIVPAFRAGAPRGPARPHPYIEEMTRRDLLSELVTEHNATEARGGRQLPDGELRVLLRFLRWRRWSDGIRATAGDVKSLQRRRRGCGGGAECL